MKSKVLNSAKAFIVALALIATTVTVGPSPKANAVATSCYPEYGFATICLDPTTGYGPLVYVYDNTGVLRYATGVTSMCVGFPTSVYTKYDSGTLVTYGDGPYVHLTTYGRWCNSQNAAVAIATQTQLDNIRWYSNMYGVYLARAVQ